ncbi:MAG TPA: carboxypeptidase-like regulatory domain-containing protein, partial [Thermoanaerobaculia bacterium]|nr:carboxypeptidase-like regulatory domain-containing protein [Thermoanaerobaculia bacterium]
MRFAKGSLILGLLMWTAASGVGRAQSTTGTLRGNVTDETGGTLPGATVEAKNDDTGFYRNATTAGNGFFNISVQPGPYTVTATLPSFRTETRHVRVLLGETQGLDFRMVLEARATQAVTVTAEAPVIETKSNEIATNVTEEQIKNLPQGSRNFLNFAALAPGVRLSDSLENRQVTAAGAEGYNTNVFIDGSSYKNDVLLGGVVGQDSSKGNPFPQNAVQEFRVMTQNFKAEYEKAGTAVITAVTKSGTNQYSGDVFAYYQNRNLVARSPFLGPRRTCNAAGVCTGTDDPDYTRWQGGADLGGPLVKDKVNFFGSYEINDQKRANTVIRGGQPL